ncbi:MAG TPA: LpxD N-terminal domain-containing protein, partial [Steroidobacteraceae bacterium]
MSKGYSLGELAVRFGLELRGDPALRVSHVATLAQATEGSLSFLANSRYRKHLGNTRASAVVVSPSDVDACPVAALVDRNPYLAYARIATLIYPTMSVAAGVHPSAVVAPGARVAPSAA